MASGWNMQDVGNYLGRNVAVPFGKQLKEDFEQRLAPAGWTLDLLKGVASGAMAPDEMPPMQAGMGNVKQADRNFDVGVQDAGGNTQSAWARNPTSMEPTVGSNPNMMNASYNPAGSQEMQLRQLMNQLQAKQIEGINSQKRALAGNEAEVASFKENGGNVDLSPLAALSDTWFGGNLKAGYKSPMSAEERQLKGVALSDLLQKQRQGITDDELANLRLNIQDKLGMAKAGKVNAGHILPKTATDDFRDFEMATKMLPDLGKRITASSKDMGPATGFGALMPYNAAQRDLKAEFDTMKQLFGKTLEGGVLRKEDEAKYAYILPNIYDLPGVALKKVDRLNKYFSDKMNNSITAYDRAGYNVGKFQKVSTPARSGGDGQSEKIKAAKDAGYSDAEIEEYLNAR